MQRTPRQVYEDVSTLISQIESGVTNVQNKHGKWTVRQHFTTCRKNRTWIVDCWCGVTFASQCLDLYDIEERFIPWINEHAACPPKEHS